MRRPPLLLLLTVVLAAGDAPPPAAGDAAPAAGLAEPPHWTFGFMIPKEVVASWKEAKPGRGGPGADVIGWVPPGATRLRAVLMFANNTDLVKIGEHAEVRKVAAKHGIGILYLRELGGNAIERVEPPEQAQATFTAILDQAATISGIASFRHAPWITLGKSSRGRFPYRMAWWFPDRVLASIAYHGEAPEWPMPAWSKVADGHTPLHLNIQGLSEWDGTWYRHVRPSLLNYHQRTGWLAHQVVIYGVDHGYYMDYFLYPNHGARLEKNHRHIRVTQVWDYIALFIDKAMQLRVPADADASERPVALKPVTRDGGFLIHPRAPEELLGSKWFALRRDAGQAWQVIKWPDEPSPVFEREQGVLPRELLVRPAAQVPAEERANHLWIADRELLAAWLKLHNLYGIGDKLIEALPKQP